MSGPKEIRIDMPPLVHIEAAPPKEQQTKTASTGGFFGEHKILIICCTIVVIIAIIIICVYYWGKRDLDVPMFSKKMQQHKEEEKLKKENEEEMIKLRSIQRAKQNNVDQSNEPTVTAPPDTTRKTVRFSEPSSDKKDNHTPIPSNTKSEIPTSQPT